MSFEHKVAWTTAIVMIVVPGAYGAWALSAAQGVDVATINYMWPMIWAIGAVILGVIGLTIGSAIATGMRASYRLRFSKDPALVEDAQATLDSLGAKDERDNLIDLRGERVGSVVLGLGGILPLGLAISEAPHFWIANAMFAVAAIAAVVAAASKLAMYRKGF